MLKTIVGSLMKIAITADIHLKTEAETPERYNALKNIFKQIEEKGLTHLIIAGDLFDKDFSNYNDFDTLCKQHSSIKIKVIPGNHDYQVENRFFTSSNIEVINDVRIEDFDGVQVVFVPYDSTKSSIDEAVLEHTEKLPQRWILIGHGDYITNAREQNPYELGLYMPITSRFIIKHNPLRVFLGHIHKPSDFGRIIYPGSACGLNITETGKRRFIIYDTRLDYIEEAFISTDKIYFDERLIVFPFEHNQFLQRNIKEMIEKWNLSADELKKATLRLSLKGYTTDLKETEKNIAEIISSYGITLYEDRLDLSEIKVLNESEEDRIYILQKVKEKIEGLDLSKLAVSKEKIIEQSMQLIFGQ